MKGALPTKTPAEHKRAGTFRADRHRRKPPIADLEAPSMPPGLTPAMKTAWKTLVASLREAETLSSIDAGVIEAAAVFWGRAREARAIVNRAGFVHVGDRGLVQHPAVRVERESWNSFRLLAEQFGMSPAARARLGLTGGPPLDMQAELERVIGPALHPIEPGRRRRKAA